jgi:nuclear pore complex protein Nup98-Nup96
MDTLNEPFHKSTKPCWGPNGTLVYTTTSQAPRLDNGVLVSFRDPVVGQKRDVRFAKLGGFSDVSGDDILISGTGHLLKDL